MAEEIVGIKIQVNGQDKVLTSIRDVKAELKKAEEEAKTFALQGEAGAAKFQEASNRVKQLKNAVEDSTKAVQQFGFKEKIAAFSGAAQGISGAFTAAQGALGALGLQGSNTEKALLKVQSALAITQGLQSIQQGIESFKDLGKIIVQTTLFQKANTAATVIATTIQKAFGASVVGTGRAFNILKGAIVATGIGALVVGIGFLVDKIMTWIDTTDDAADAQKRLAAKNELVNASIQNQIDLLTAQGGKEKEIYQLKKDQIENELNTIRESVKKKGGFNDEELKKFRDLKTQKEILDINEKKRIKKDEDDAKAKTDAKAKEDADKLKAEADKRAAEYEKIKAERQKEREDRIAAEKSADQELKKIKEENFLNSIKDDNQRALKKLQIDLAKEKERIEALDIDKYKKRQLLLQTEIQFENQSNEIKKKIDDEAKQKQIDANNKFVEKQKAALDKNVADAKAALETKNKLAEEEAKFKQQQLNETADALGKLGEIVGKETVAGKALGIATALINTYQGATEALKQKSTLPSPFDFAAKAINVAAIIASGIKAVKAITAVKVPGGGGGVSAPITSITAGGAAPISPETPGATLTQLDQGTINRLGSATNRSYVLESDVTNSQERIRRINRAARLN